jgi:branched-chain amino acid transport system substrate-binding protein
VQSLADEFIAAFVAGGGQMVLTPATPPEAAATGSPGVDLDTAVAEIVAAKPDVVYVPAGYPVANQVGSQVRAQAVGLTLIGSEAWDNGALDLQALEGAYFTLHYSRQTPYPIARAWEERYLSAFAMEPDTLAALGYDAANLLASGMQSAASLSPDDVARALETLEFEGVTGHWRFDSRHNPLKPVVVVRIEEGDVIFYKDVQP